MPKEAVRAETPFPKFKNYGSNFANRLDAPLSASTFMHALSQLLCIGNLYLCTKSTFVH